MSWMFSTWVAAALLALCSGEKAAHEGNILSASGYHLCIRNVTRNVTLLAMHQVPFTIEKPCGGWLLWEMCTITLYRMTHGTEYKTVTEQVTSCCDGYVQVGRYCALPLNRSGEFTAKPGACPTAHGLYPGSEDCEWDMDCPGWQKCCLGMDRSLCSYPASSSNHSKNGGYRYNATVTVKMDYEQVMSKKRGLLNHMRLLQSMVTGALQTEVSVYYINSWPVYPYRTATSLLIECNFTSSLNNVTTKLYLLLKHIQEVSSVLVEDVDECELQFLRQCSPQAHCNNTVGSYQCACQNGYTDVDPKRPGARCTAIAIPELLSTFRPSKNTTYTPASILTQNPQGISTTDLVSSTQSTLTTAPRNTGSDPYHSSPAPTGSPKTSIKELPQPTTTCSSPSITSLWSANVTATSFCVYWSSQFQMNQTYRVVVRKGSEVICILETSWTMMEMRGLDPGVLYNVTVTPCACGSQGRHFHISVRTDAQTLDATARLTNIQFTAELQNTSSQAYKNLTESIAAEIYQSLSAEMKGMVDSGQVRIEIRDISPGSVVVNFTITIIPSQSQDVSTASAALLHSLMYSTRYTVDQNNTHINDFNECASGENDCSQWATCTNIWASYTCACLVGFKDNNQERPGRACEAISTMETMASTTFSTASAMPFPQNKSPTNDPTLVSATSAPGITTLDISANEIVFTLVSSTTVPDVITAQSTTANITPTHTKMSASPTTSTAAPTETITAPGITASLSATITTPKTTITAQTTINDTPRNITTTPTAITMAQRTTSSPLTTTPTPQTTINTALTKNITAQTATITAPTLGPADVSTTIISPLPTTSVPVSTTTAPTTTLMSTTTTSVLTATTTAPTTTITAPTTNASMLGAISVQCRGTAITVTVARDFLSSTSIRESTLYLGLLRCGVNGGNATHAQLTVAWNECATQLVHNETYYTASVTLFNTMDQYISANGTMEAPKMRLEVPIVCGYMRSMLISADFSSMGYDMYTDVIMGSGSFQVTVQLMNGTVPLPHNYSLSSEEAVVVDVSLNTSSEDIKVVINKCWATPTRNPGDSYSHIFLENSCSLNIYTKVLMNGNSSTSQVSVQIFSFVDLNVIYLHCQVQICAQIGSNSCVPDCLQRIARASPNTIGTALGSFGPLLKSDEEALEEDLDTLQIVGLSCLGIGLSLCFIVAFVCLFYYQRNRIGHYNFNVKPKQDNFTYLVFNT